MDYETLKATRNQENPFALYIGASVTEISHGHAEVSLLPGNTHSNLLGTVHGGCLYALADIAAGSAIASLDCLAVTATGEYHYFLPGQKGSAIKAIAEIVKAGKTLVTTEVTLKSESGDVLGKAIFVHTILKSQHSD